MLPIKPLIVLASFIVPLIHAAATTDALVPKRRSSSKGDGERRVSWEKPAAPEMDAESHWLIETLHGSEDGLSIEQISPEFIQYFLANATEEQLEEALQAKRQEREAREGKEKGTKKWGKKESRRAEKQKEGKAQVSKKHEAPHTEESEELVSEEDALSMLHRQERQPARQAREKEHKAAVKDATPDVHGRREAQKIKSIKSTLAGLINDGVAEEQYRLGKVIGSGLFGKVYQGTHAGEKSKLAIKTIPLTSETKIWFANWELYALKMMKHGSVVKLHSAYLSEDGKSLYFAMPYVRGESLYNWIDRRAKELRKAKGLVGDDARIMPRRAAKSVARQLFLGLRAIHKAEVSHGDIDTSNIRIKNPEDYPNAKIHIVDMGFARSNDAEKLEADIIRMTLAVLELGMTPEKADTPRLPIAWEHFGGALISIPRWINDVEIARLVFSKTQSGEIDVYPELRRFVKYVMQLDENKRLTIDNVLAHSYLAKAGSK